MRLRGILPYVLAATALGNVTLAQEKKPAVPPGRDPGGVAIALLSTGIDYTIPEVVQRLARDGEGELIGWDLVDKDRKPFDKSKGGTRPEWGGDGTALVRSILTPGKRVIPVRIDPADPVSLARAVAFVAQTPARIVVVPMWGPDKTVWEPFRQAATHFTDLLFIVAAGDDGRDIDEEPVWPAAFGLPNVLVVSPIAMPLLHHSGRANWGRHTVGAHASVLAMVERGPMVPDNSRTAAMQIAGTLAGCWSQLLGVGNGERVKTAWLAQAGKPWPGHSAPYIEPCGQLGSGQPKR